MENIFGTADFKNTAKKEDKKVNVSITFYEDDYELFDQVIEHLLFKKRQRNANITNVFAEGMELLKEKYGKLPKRENVKYARGGRRNNDYKVKISSIWLTKENAEYYKDFMFYKIFGEENSKYFSYDFTREIIRLLADKYNISYEN